ncbi:MAG: hypothetical protein V3V12_00910 [Gammaproteobacteria bacterium]
MNTTQYAEFFRGTFYLSATITTCVLLYLVVKVWQPIWTHGFDNFDDISYAIGRLDKTAKPVAEMAPLILGEMDAMRNSMYEMQRSMKNMESITQTVSMMNQSVDKMAWVLENRMGAMAGEMNQINDRMSPATMLPFNW